MIQTLPLKIHSDYNPNINWEKGGRDYNLHSTDAHIWTVRVPNNFNNLFREYRSILSEEEFFKAKAFYWEQDFKRYLTGRIVLRILLSKYLVKSINDIRFDLTSRKPTIFSNTPLKYNLSYAGDLISISIGLCETGVDIEFINPDLDFKDILLTCFSKDEIKGIDDDQINSRQEFFLQWTRKEALLKYTGQGIIDDLTEVPSLYGTHKITTDKLELDIDINLLSFHLSSNCVGSLAYPNSVTRVKYFEWQ